MHPFEEYTIEVIEELNGHLYGQIQEIPKAGQAIGHNLRELTENLKPKYEIWREQNPHQIILTAKEIEDAKEQREEAARAFARRFPRKTGMSVTDEDIQEIFERRIKK